MTPPGTLTIRARIPVDPANRAFCVTATLNGGVVRRSCEDLQSDQDEGTVHILYWRDAIRESGEYTILLSVARSDGSTVSASCPFTLRGIDDADRSPEHP